MNDNLTPHLTDEATPLENLIHRAFRRYGEMSPDTMDGETSMMMIELANEVIEYLNQHPYRVGEPDIPLYVSLADIRDIPDAIMIAGLKAMYALQQLSPRADVEVPQFFAIMNKILWNRSNGNKPITMSVPDRR